MPLGEVGGRGGLTRDEDTAREGCRGIKDGKRSAITRNIC